MCDLHFFLFFLNGVRSRTLPILCMGSVEKQDLVEVGAGGEGTDVGKAKIIERLCESFKPTVLLSDDGNLKHKNQFRSDMEKYTRYNKAVLKDFPEGLYFDIFCSFCDQDMKAKLTNINDY